jgi:hypothetical protein
MTRYAIFAQYPDGDIDDQQVSLFNDLGDALNARDQIDDGMEPKFKVFAMREVSEEQCWDWATRRTDSDQRITLYVNERAARNCCQHGHEVVKRRLGTQVWLPVAGDAA